ncbi:MAG TPA: Rho termination factor N-terminal domain-containing protein, partial [Propionibacteriaceae bacterium]
MTEIAEVTSASPHDEGTGEQSKQLTSDRRNRKGSGLDSMVLAELKQLASSLGIKGTGAMRKSQLIDAIRSAQRGPGADAPPDQVGKDNGQRSPQDDRDNRDVAGALDELQRAPREASDEREEAQMLEHPVQPELVAATQPASSTPDQRHEPVETVDDGQVREERGTPQDGNDSQQV